MQRMLEDIKEHVQRMDDSGDVDLSILDKIKALRANLKESANKWAQYPDNDAFYYYSAVRTIDLVLDRMEERFSKALENKDNPQIAIDAMTILPFIDNVMQMTNAPTIKKDGIDTILKHTWNIRIEATKIDLISPAPDLKSIDKKELGEIFDGMLDYIGIPAKLPTLDELDENLDIVRNSTTPRI